MKLAVLFSGGKDSVMAMHKAMQQGHEIACLVTLKSENPASYMFHTTNINLAESQAKAMDLPIIEIETKGEKEKELEDLEKGLKEAKEKFLIEGAVSGALASNYQFERVGNTCKKLDLESIAPLWQMDDLEYMRQIVGSGFEVIIMNISADGLGKDFLGKKIDKELLNKLIKAKEKFHFHLSGEGGEYDTFVVDGPVFKKRLMITDSEIIMEDKHTGRFIIKETKLVEK